MLLVMAGHSSQAGAIGGNPADVEIVVSPEGNDAAKGTAQEPVATLHQAQVLERTALAHGRHVKVTLMGGVYRLHETLVFTQQDSGTAEFPVLWQALPGQKVIVSGGALLKVDWEPYRNGNFKADVPADFTSDGLFVDGVCQHMARYPDFDPNQRIMNGYAADCISPERVARWADPTGGYIHAMHSHLWGDYHYRITGKNADGTLRYEGGWQNNRQMGMHRGLSVRREHSEELDAPGEWYHDANIAHAVLLPAGRNRHRCCRRGVGAAAASCGVPRERSPNPCRIHHLARHHVHARGTHVHGHPGAVAPQ